ILPEFEVEPAAHLKKFVNYLSITGIIIFGLLKVYNRFQLVSSHEQGGQFGRDSNPATLALTWSPSIVGTACLVAYARMAVHHVSKTSASKGSIWPRCSSGLKVCNCLTALRVRKPWPTRRPSSSK